MCTKKGNVCLLIVLLFIVVLYVYSTLPLPWRYPVETWRNIEHTDGQSMVIITFGENLLNDSVLMFVDVDRLEPGSIDEVASDVVPAGAQYNQDFLTRRMQVIQQLIQQDAILYCEKRYGQGDTLILSCWMLHYKIRDADVIIQLDYLTGKYMWWYL